MSNDRLAAALTNGAHRSALAARDKALRRADSHRGLYHDCGFCGRDFGSALLSGPLCGICPNCTQVAQGFYLAVARDRLKLPQDFDRAWRSAINDYSQTEGKPPEIKPPVPSNGAEQ